MHVILITINHKDFEDPNVVHHAYCFSDYLIEDFDVDNWVIYLMIGAVIKFILVGLFFFLLCWSWFYLTNLKSLPWRVFFGSSLSGGYWFDGICYKFLGQYYCTKTQFKFINFY